VVVDHTTCEPEAAVEFARALEQQGAFFVDAPVSGGPTRAADGSLVAMAGGRAEIVEKVAPILAAYAAAVHNCGEVGRGQTLKLVNQYLVIIHAVAAAEAASLVEAAGIDATTAHDALMSGWAASAMLDLVLPPALAREFASRGAPLGPLADIAAMVATAANRARIRSALLPAASVVLGRAVEKGFADAGFSALIEAVEHQT
jgi:3-hydroxyisobutyrate dehydrogenase-like beta-hydroxyacid dehydrogenase